MTTILVIHPYFGKFPNIFPFWLESCKLNKTIDFLIATDQPITSPAPNIHIWNTTLPEIKRRIENITNIPVWLEQPYKLCDFRPLFGQTFNEYTSKYDFWGYCDCDLIFGNIRAFLTEDILSNYDYIMGWGHFHIQRTNDPKFEKVWKTARGLWKNINWKEVFQSNKNEWFDELPHGVSGRYYELYPEKCWMGYKNNHACYESPTPSCLTFRSLFNDYCLWKQWDGYQLHKKRLPFLKRQPGGDLNNAIFYKNNADLYIIGTNENGNIEKRPILYAHFYKRKLSINTTNLSKYIIRPNALIQYKSPNKVLLYFYSHHPSIYWNYTRYRLNRKLNNMIK